MMRAAMSVLLKLRPDDETRFRIARRVMVVTIPLQALPFLATVIFYQAQEYLAAVSMASRFIAGMLATLCVSYFHSMRAWSATAHTAFLFLGILGMIKIFEAERTFTDQIRCWVEVTIDQLIFTVLHLMLSDWTFVLSVSFACSQLLFLVGLVVWVVQILLSAPSSLPEDAESFGAMAIAYYWAQTFNVVAISMTYLRYQTKRGGADAPSSGTTPAAQAYGATPTAPASATTPAAPASGASPAAPAAQGSHRWHNIAHLAWVLPFAAQSRYCVTRGRQKQDLLHFLLIVNASVRRGSGYPQIFCEEVCIIIGLFLGSKDIALEERLEEYHQRHWTMSAEIFQQALRFHELLQLQRNGSFSSFASGDSQSSLRQIWRQIMRRF
eukprot:TRINITY_DN9082_c0_g1_i1.p1 TRINITY_DN9082_c0_g1~~TRINITY_DN9082_c0_g1_i1.p1  ORF type:complete len:382 (+),score=37.36 TRINITY_DN9082_c0_g1_i1:21-1166(+)